MIRPLEPGDPRVLGRFLLLGRLGEGGMGVVYLGRDDAGTLAAVKVVLPEFAGDEGFRLRFRQEIATMRRLTGPLVARLLDADLDAAWLATTYFSGVSLTDRVAAHGVMDPVEVLGLGAGLARALIALHAGDVVHRDLKPDNILLTGEGPRVIDFGIARAADDTHLTRTGYAIGTPSYMAPEQRAGRRDIGPAADVYAFGGVLLFAMTGRPPAGSAGLPGGQPGRLIRDCLRDEPGDRPTAEELLRRCGIPDSPDQETTMNRDGPPGLHVGDNSVGSVSFGDNTSFAGDVNIGTHVHAAPESDPLAAGLAALHSGQYASAVTEFEQAVRDPARAAEAHFSLAVALFNGRRPGLSTRAVVKRAEGELARILRAAPGHAPSLLLEAIIKDDYYLPNEYAFAGPSPRELFRLALPRLDPAAPEITLLLAHVPTPTSPAWRYLRERSEGEQR